MRFFIFVLEFVLRILRPRRAGSRANGVRFREGVTTHDSCFGLVCLDDAVAKCITLFESFEVKP
jgi:hypothetical protein